MSNPRITTGTEQFTHRGHVIEVRRYSDGQRLNLFVKIDGEAFNLAPFDSLKIALELAREQINERTN